MWWQRIPDLPSVIEIDIKNVLTNRMRACTHAKMGGSKSQRDSVGVSSASEGKEPLQVRIPARIKRAFKTRAAMRDIEPNRLFVEMWEHYERTGPDAKVD